MALIGASNSLGGLAGSNALARLLVVISGDASPLTNAVRSAEGTLSGFSGKASAIGRTFTRYLTLPLLALSGVALKMAVDFNAAVARVAGLTPIMEDTGMSLQDISDSILALASDPRITAGPKDLADALYFAGSAGLNFGEAMEVVKLSAEGASIGMGEASDVSKVLIYAMNAYAGTGLTAAGAMDALTAAIREGTAEPNEMAVALGRLLPIAAAAGITFQQVTASVAALTNLGMPVRVATTSLRALFTGIFTPTIEATETLHALGLEAEDLRQTMQAGPIAVFQLLGKVTKNNFDYLHDVIPTIRGFTAYLGLTGNAAEKYKNIMNEVVNSQGDFNHAMDIFVQTPAFKFQKALQSMQIAAIELGSSMLPVFTKIMDGINRIATAFADLPDWAMKATASLIGMAAAIGPILQLVGAITEVRAATLAAGTAGGLQTMVPTMRAIGVGAGAAALGLGILAISFSDVSSHGLQMANSLGIIAGSFMVARVALAGLVAAANAGVLGVNAFGLAVAGLSPGVLTGIAVAISAIALAIGYFVSQSHRMERDSAQMQEAMYQGAVQGQTFKDTIDGIKSADLAAEFMHIASAAKLLKLPTQVAMPKALDAYAANFISNLERIKGSMRDLPEGEWDLWIAGVREATRTGIPLDKVLQKDGTSLDEMINALGDAETRARGTTDGMEGVTAAAHEQVFGVEDMTQAWADYRQSQQATLYAHVMEGKAVEDMARKYGVSTEFIQSHLDDVGLSAWGMSNTTEKAWAAAEFVTTNSGDKISAKMTEMQDAIDATATSISDSLVGAFDLFNKLPAKFKGSADSMLKNTQSWADAMVEQAVNVRELIGRGVPLDMLEKLIADGPDAVAKFASLSKSELDRAVIAYKIGLGAMDKAILEEGAHQVVKGRDMVSGFVTSMLSRNYLLAGAGAQIVAIFQSGIASGDLRPSAMSLMTQFVNFLTAQVPLTREAGSKVAVTFAQALANKPLMQRSSQQIMAWVTGALQTAGIGKKKADDLAFAFVNGLNAKSGTIETQAQAAVAGAVNMALSGLPAQAHAIGVAIDLQLAGGIKSAGGAAILAAETVATNVENALKNSLRNSPKLFTYYVGKDLVKELGEGVKHGNRDVQMHRPTVSVYDNRGPLDRGRANGTVSKRPLEVRLDRKRFTQEIAYEETYRGLL